MTNNDEHSFKPGDLVEAKYRVNFGSVVVVPGDVGLVIETTEKSAICLFKGCIDTEFYKTELVLIDN